MPDSLAAVARATPALGCDQVVAIREHGDQGYVLFNNSADHDFLIGVAYQRTKNGWKQLQLESGSGWSHYRPDQGTCAVSSWGSAPPGADRIRVEFQGAIREDDVTNGVYFLIWWDVPRLAPEPFVTAFRINGQWNARQRPPDPDPMQIGLVSVFEQPTQVLAQTQWDTDGPNNSTGVIDAFPVRAWVKSITHRDATPDDDTRYFGCDGHLDHAWPHDQLYYFYPSEAGGWAFKTDVPGSIGC